LHFASSQVQLICIARHDAAEALCTQYAVDNKSGQTVKAKCNFVVYVDKPQVVLSQQHPAPFCAPAAADGPDSHEDIVRPATTHVMQLTGAVAGAMARVLFDSGAEQHNYISTAFCERIGVTLRDNKSPLSVVGIAGAAAQTVQQCTATLRMQGLASQLSFLVIDMPAAFDVILGDA
jgi:hypothetical protein